MTLGGLAEVGARTDTIERIWGVLKDAIVTPTAILEERELNEKDRWGLESRGRSVGTAVYKGATLLGLPVAMMVLASSGETSAARKDQVATIHCIKPLRPVDALEIIRIAVENTINQDEA